MSRVWLYDLWNSMQNLALLELANGGQERSECARLNRQIFPTTIARLAVQALTTFSPFRAEFNLSGRRGDQLPLRLDDAHQRVWWNACAAHVQLISGVLTRA